MVDSQFTFQTDNVNVAELAIAWEMTQRTFDLLPASASGPDAIREEYRKNLAAIHDAVTHRSAHAKAA